MNVHKLPLTLNNIKKQIQRYGFNLVVNDIIALATIIKAENGKITEWAKDINPEYTTEFIKSNYFDFKTKKFISNDISSFQIPVYQPYITPTELKIADTYRTYSNKYFNLKDSKLNLAFLDKTWDIWYDLLTESFNDVYSITTLNTLIGVFVEIKRSIMSTLNKFDGESNKHKFDDIIGFAKTIQESGIKTFDYSKYYDYPLSIQIALDGITEGIPEFYLNAKHRINIHNFIPCNKILSSIIKHVETRELNQFNTPRIKRLVYVLTRNIDVKLDLTKTLQGQQITLIADKIEYLVTLFRHVIYIQNNTVKFKTKFVAFKRLYQLVLTNDTTFTIINETPKPSKGSDLAMFKWYEIKQTKLIDIVRILFYDLFITAKHSNSDAFTSDELILIESIFKNPPKNFNPSDFSYDIQSWFDPDMEVPFKFNYLPFERYEASPKRFELSLTSEAYKVYMDTLALQNQQHQTDID